MARKARKDTDNNYTDWNGWINTITVSPVEDYTNWPILRAVVNGIREYVKDFGLDSGIAGMLEDGSTKIWFSPDMRVALFKAVVEEFDTPSVTIKGSFESA